MIRLYFYLVWSMVIDVKGFGFIVNINIKGFLGESLLKDLLF